MFIFQTQVVYDSHQVPWWTPKPDNGDAYIRIRDDVNETRLTRYPLNLNKYPLRGIKKYSDDTNASSNELYYDTTDTQLVMIYTTSATYI